LVFYSFDFPLLFYIVIASIANSVDTVNINALDQKFEVKYLGSKYLKAKYASIDNIKITVDIPDQTNVKPTKVLNINMLKSDGNISTSV